MTRHDCVDWDQQPLGLVDDTEIAERLGVAVHRVRAARRYRKIPDSTPRPQRKNIVWDEQPLGLESDSSIARQLGVTPSTVTLVRQRRGILRFCGPGRPRKPKSEDVEAPTKKPKIDWDAQPLGIERDAVIARRLGVARQTVFTARTARGIPPPTIDWDEQPFETKSDAQIAERTGMKVKAVSSARQRRGIPRPLRARNGDS